MNRDGLLTHLFLAASPSAYRRAGIALAILIGLAFTACLVFGCSQQGLFPGDAALLLDGGWRLYQGQRPHTDFYSPLGVVPLLVTASGMWLLGPDDRALQTGYTLLLPLAALWAWLLLRQRLAAFPAFLCASLLGILLVGTRPLNGVCWFPSYAMQYNRLGWALFCLLAATVVVPPMTPRSRLREWLEGTGAGVLLALLLFTKVNYGAMSVGLVVVAPMLFGLERRLILGLVVGVTATSLALLTYLHFDVPALLTDIRMLGGVQRLPARLQELGEVLVENAAWLALLALVLLLYLNQPGKPVIERLRWSAAALLLCGIGIVICSANAQQVDIPTFGLAALLLAENLRRRLNESGDEVARAAQRPFLLTSVTGAVLVALILVPDLISITDSLVWPALPSERATALPLHSERLPRLLMQQRDADRQETRTPEDAMLELPDEEGKFFTAYQYGVWINDGIALLRPHVTSQSCIVVFDWVNPYNFALGLCSPRGDALWWHYGRVMDDEHHPSAEAIMHDATLVMVPRRGSHLSDTAFLERHCGPLVKTQFQKLGETRLWSLYGRRSSAAGDAH